jgi:gliding motility-associated-like protein
MIVSFRIKLIIGLCLSMSIACQAQNIAGTWLGVTYPTDPNQAVYNYFVNMTQTGTVIGGTAQTANPKVDFGGLAYIKGAFNNPKLTFKESNQSGGINDNLTCYWDVKLTYDPVNESLIGTYDAILNSPYCTDGTGGKMELYRIVLKSGTKFCRGSMAQLNVTGKNIRWYDSAAKTKLLATGNTFSTTLTQTTTFYITQTLYNSESPPIPILVEAIGPVIQDIKTTSASCIKPDGTITITANATDPATLQYGLGTAGGIAYQKPNTFANLSAGQYQVTVVSDGCTTTGLATVAQLLAPKIDDIKTVKPTCGAAKGEIAITASGGSSPLTYSIDGTNFQNTGLFKGLGTGTFNVSVKDNQGCPSTKTVVTFAQTTAPKITSVTPTATKCGKDNGTIVVVSSGGTGVQYSLDSLAFQANGTFANVKAGDYKIVIKDTDNCSASQSVKIGSSIGPKITTIVPSKNECGLADGQLVITATPAAGIQFSIDGSRFQNSSTFGNLLAADYTVTLKDGVGCMESQKYILADNCELVVFLPTAFSPNGDGLNDTFTAQFPFKTLKIVTFTVFNRWGVAIYDKSGFVLSQGEPIWDGLSDGQAVRSNTYPYKLEVEFADGSRQEYRQTVVVLK